MRMVLRTMILGLGLAVVSCGGDESVTYNADSLYPENWEETYTLKKDCAPSPTHGSDHVKVWASPEANAAFDDRATEMPAGAVLMKSQYSDSGCTEPSGFTAMRADEVGTDGAVTWYWQRTETDGSIGAEGGDNFCNNCHVACANGICSEP